MQILHLVQSRAFAIFTRCSFQIFINPDFYSTIYLTLAAISQVWEYFHMLNIVKSATIMISCSFHTYSNFHSSQHWLDFARLPDFCLVTWQVWLSLWLHGKCGKVFTRSILSFCCQISAWTMNANEPINIWKHDRRSGDENYMLIV